MSARNSLTILLLFFVHHGTYAQETPDDNAVVYSPNMSISGSYSPTSFRAWGTFENTRQLYLSVQLYHSELTLGNSVFQFGSGVILAGWIHFPSNGISGPKESRIGLGLVPLEVNIPLSQKRHTPFITSSAGFMITDADFPNHLGSRFNYLIDIGAGYHFRISDMHTIQVGYKLHHLSNGNSSTENPGIDSHMFFSRFLFRL